MSTNEIPQDPPTLPDWAIVTVWLLMLPAFGVVNAARGIAAAVRSWR